MRPTTIIVILVVLVIVLLVLRAIAGDVRAWWRVRAAEHRRRRATWAVQPRSLPNGDRQVWLVREGTPDFLFETVYRDDYGRINEQKWDDAIYRAEEQGLEWDRLRRVIST